MLLVLTSIEDGRRRHLNGSRRAITCLKREAREATWVDVARSNPMATSHLSSRVRLGYDSGMDVFVYLERIEPAENMARYYRLSVTETLFGGWAMTREWGRIGRRGQSLEQWCETRPDAVALLERHRTDRIKRGYEVTQM